MEGSKIYEKYIQLFKIHQPKGKKILELYYELWNYIAFTKSSVLMMGNKTDRSASQTPPTQESDSHLKFSPRSKPE